MVLTGWEMASRSSTELTSTDLRQAGQEVAAAQGDAQLLFQRVGGAGGDLGVLGGALADDQVVVAAGVLDDGVVDLVAGDADASG